MRLILVACLLLGIGAVALVLALVASDSPAPAPAPVLEARGFLATFTPSPTPTRAPDARVGAKGECPPLARTMCARPGDAVDLYEDLRLADVLFVKLTYCCSEERWIADSPALDELLLMLDRDVTAEPSVFDVMQSARAMLPDPFAIQFLSRGRPWAPHWAASFELNLNLRDAFVADAASGTQWPLPDGFAERLRTLADDQGTTATPERELFATSTPTVAARPVFVHPPEPLVWDGPDDAVVSRAEGHCAAELGGAPGHIAFGRGIGFWLEGPVAADPRWRWTGYKHDRWRIMQGDDPLIIYLVNDDDPGVALRYRWFPCA